MPHLKKSSSRLRLLALPAVAILVAGCSASGSTTGTTVTATESTSVGFTVYLSDPPAVRKDPSLQDVVEGEELAWTDFKPKLLKRVTIKLVIAKSAPSYNARAAINQADVLAYVGEVQQGESAQTVGITNAEDVLEISPTDQVLPDKNDFEDNSTYGKTFASIPIDLTTPASALLQAAPTFKSQFTQDFGHSPSADAIDGYDAVYALIRVMAYLGDQANDRTKIAKDTIAFLKDNKGKADVASFTFGNGSTAKTKKK